MPSRRNTTTMASAISYNQKMRRAGVKVKNQKARSVAADQIGKNANGSWTSNGANNQGYNKETGRFTQPTTHTKSGKMSVDGRRAGGLTHTVSLAPEERTDGKRSGRGGKLASRRQRYYDLVQAMNNPTEGVMQANNWTAGGRALSAG